MIWLLHGLSRSLVIPFNNNVSTFYLGRLGNYTPFEVTLTLDPSVKSTLKCCQQKCAADAVSASDPSVPLNVSLSPRKFLKERTLSVSCGSQNILKTLDLMPQNASFCYSDNKITIMEQSSAFQGTQIKESDLASRKSFLRVGKLFYEHTDCQLKSEFLGFQILIALALVMLTLFITKNKNKQRQQLVPQPQMVESSRSIQTNDNQLMPDDHQFFE